MSSLYLDLCGEWGPRNTFQYVLYLFICYFMFLFLFYLCNNSSDNVTVPTMTVAGMYNCTLLLEKITDDANAKLYVKSFLPFPLI